MWDSLPDGFLRLLAAGSVFPLLAPPLHHCNSHLTLTPGTLGEANRAEVQQYLSKMGRMKKFSKHVLVGDLNLSGTSWPDGETNSSLERGFVDIFNDLAFDQLMDQPTHVKGRVLDLLLTNSPSLISDVSILGHNEVCSSDHFCITFNIRARVKRKKVTKRKSVRPKSQFPYQPQSICVCAEHKLDRVTLNNHV